MASDDLNARVREARWARRRGALTSHATVGRVQRCVLASLADGEERCARDLADDWPGLTDSSVYAAIRGLANRGWVDAAGWKGNARTYTLTRNGAEQARLLFGDDETREWTQAAARVTAKAWANEEASRP